MKPSVTNECTKNATNEIYIIDENGEARYLHPYGVDQVPAIYGHLSVMVEEDSNNSLAKKKIYYFGGRLGTADPNNWSYCQTKSPNFGLCADIFVLTVPSVPLKLTPWSSSSDTTAVWERIDTGPFPSDIINPGIIFGNMAYLTHLNLLFIFNGYKEEDSTSWNTV